MRVSLSRAGASMMLAVGCAILACGRTPPASQPPRPPQTSGTLQVKGLQAPVIVLRDRYGIPHITAANTGDLFFAQGFVQAQDRLFQMDLWKRSVQGHLSEVLGANFIQRDSMTRRIQFRGDLEREWASYGPDAHTIAVAFTSGINAWIRLVGNDLPEEFALAGWRPEFWRPEDLLNRTDAFLASTGAQTELLRARLVTAIGVERARELMPLPDGVPAAVDPAVDLSNITFVVSDAVRRIGTPPFFLTLAGRVSETRRPGQNRDGGQVPAAQQVRPQDDSASLLPSRLAERMVRSTAWAMGDRANTSGGPAVGVETVGSFRAPSSMYLVHLTAPGWNVIGAARPWLPGVVVGHNERIAWGMVPLALDTQDIFAERVNPADPHQVWRDGRWVNMSVDLERVSVKGREQPVQYERQYTSNGVVIAQDRERNLVYTLKWTGTEPGGAGELAALNIARADSWPAFTEALARWTAPAAEFTYADATGAIGRQQAGLVPGRGMPGAGATPSAGWATARQWTGVRSLGDAGGLVDRSGALTLAAGSGSLRTPPPPGLRQSVPTFQDVAGTQGDLTAGSIDVVSRALNSIRTLPRELEPVRRGLDGRDRRALLEFVAAVRTIVEERAGVPKELHDEVLSFVDPLMLAWKPETILFGQNGLQDEILVSALNSIAAVSPASGAEPPVSFEHPLAVFENARSRFNIGPVGSPGRREIGTGYVVSVDGRFGASFRAKFTARDWDQSLAINAPGQSGSPASVHYDDLVAGWAAREAIPLAFTRTAVSEAVSETLTLRP